MNLLELRRVRAQRRADVREVVSEALGCACQAAEDSGDFFDVWRPAPRAEVTLCVESDDPVLRITRISSWPERSGFGSRVVVALREHVRQRGFVLEVPDPFESSMGFWRRFEWEDVGGSDRVVLRFDPSATAGQSSR